MSREGGARYTASDVRRSFGATKRWEELSGELPALFLFRPLSFWVTPLFLRLRCSPAQVTALSAAVALALPAAALLPGAHAHLAVAGLGFTFQLLDCVDGNVARVTGRTSRRGQFLDLLVGQAYWILLLASLGLLVERQGGGIFGAWALEVALLLPILVLLNRLTRHYAQLHFGREQLMDERPPGPLHPSQWLVIALAGLENLYVFAIALGGALGGLDYVLLGIAIYVSIVFVYVEATLYRDLRSEPRASEVEEAESGES